MLLVILFQSTPFPDITAFWSLRISYFCESHSPPFFLKFENRQVLKISVLAYQYFTQVDSLSGFILVRIMLRRKKCTRCSPRASFSKNLYQHTHKSVMPIWCIFMYLGGKKTEGHVGKPFQVLLSFMKASWEKSDKSYRNLGSMCNTWK